MTKTLIFWSKQGKKLSFLEEEINAMKAALDKYFQTKGFNVNKRFKWNISRQVSRKSGKTQKKFFGKRFKVDKIWPSISEKQENKKT